MRRWGTGIGNGWAQAWALVIEVVRPGRETAEEAQAVRLGGGYEHHWRRARSFELSLRRGNIAQGNYQTLFRRQSSVLCYRIHPIFEF